MVGSRRRFEGAAAALGYEVLWTRVLGVALQSTTYSFTLILTTFLCGLALGSYLYGRYFQKRVRLVLASSGCIENARRSRFPGPHQDLRPPCAADTTFFIAEATAGGEFRSGERLSLWVPALNGSVLADQQELRDCQVPGRSGRHRQRRSEYESNIHTLILRITGHYKPSPLRPVFHRGSCFRYTDCTTSSMLALLKPLEFLQLFLGLFCFTEFAVEH